MQIEIVNTMKFPSADPKRLGQSNTLVLVRIDGKRMDSISIEKDTNDPKELEALITKELQARAKVVGHKFEVK